jgi:hypothetical protein
MMLMTQPYFARAENSLALSAELLSWKDTRFWPRSGGRARKGVGADCVSFVEAVLVNVGAITPVKWPVYVIRGGGIDMRNLAINVLDSISEMGKIWWLETQTDWQKVSLLAGDVLVRSVKNDSHHMAIYAGDKTLWHAQPAFGVTTGSVGDTFAIQDMQAIYRVYDRQ